MSSARWVMVTGASSGVGRSIALLLSSRGFEILATARNETDALVLLDRNSDYIHPLIIELRDQSMIKYIVRQVAQKT